MGRATVMAVVATKKTRRKYVCTKVFSDVKGNKARRQSLLPIESLDFEVIWRLRLRRGGTFFTSRLVRAVHICTYYSVVVLFVVTWLALAQEHIAIK